MAGFAARQDGCSGIHDDLFARALVIESAATAVALISLDLLAVDSEFVAETRCAIAARVPIHPSAIMIAATHTHAGPVTIRAFFNPDDVVDRTLMVRLHTGIVNAVVMAWKHRFPARVGVGPGTAKTLGHNRRSADGEPVDREIGMLKVEDAHGGTRGVLVNYGCHPTVLGPDNLLATGDFPAMMIEILEKHIGPESFAMFVNGAEGDISAGHSSELSAIGVIAPGRTFERAMELGRELASDVLEVLPAIETNEDTCIDFAALTTELPLKQYPSPEGTAAVLHKARTQLDSFPSNQRESGEYRRAKSEALYASINNFYAGQAKRYARGAMPVELQAIRIGSAVLVAVPAEVFADVGIRIKKACGLKTFIAGVSNGYIGYLPSRHAFEYGGYEVVASICGPDAEGRLIESLKKLGDSLSRC